MKPIRTEAEYEAAVARVEELFQASAGTPEGDEFEELFDLVEAYEDEHYPIGLPHPVAAIEFCLDQQRLSPRDLVPCIGSLERVAEVLSGEHPITVPMAHALHEHFDISLEVLLQTPETEAETAPAALAAAG